ncbi:MAG: ROK family protein [Lachnospiraceae bacterium]|nr:ROK family protein [Lachnospiraceae bacterium]
MRIGALEGGGTKMVLAVCNENGEVLDRKSIPTEHPSVTMPAMIEYFKEQKVEALGIGFFGPIQLNKAAENYGCVTSTPKPGWTGQPVVGPFQETLGIPVAFDTDVNAAALGEATWGASKGYENSVYITVGTGIGAGVITNGKLLHGMQHPEAGHMLLQRHPDDTYEGKCPFHSHCMESLAAGPAIEARWGKKAYDLADRKEVWELEAYYIAQGLVNMIMTLSPEKIILGGGVMHQTHVMALIREEVKKQINGYFDTPQIRDIDNYIVLPQLNDNQGIMGCVKLALNELDGK